MLLRTGSWLRGGSCSDFLADGTIETTLPPSKLHRNLCKRLVKGLVAVGSQSLADDDPEVADLDIDRTAIGLTLATEFDACVLQLLEVRLSRREQPLLNMLRQRISKVDLEPIDPD